MSDIKYTKNDLDTHTLAIQLANIEEWMRENNSELKRLREKLETQTASKEFVNKEIKWLNERLVKLEEERSKIIFLVLSSILLGILGLVFGDQVNI